MRSIVQLRREYEEQNREAAAIIASQPEKYKGLPATWAAKVLERERSETKGTDENRRGD